jgi:hypothetical protein
MRTKVGRAAGQEETGRHTFVRGLNEKTLSAIVTKSQRKPRQHIEFAVFIKIGGKQAQIQTLAVVAPGPSRSRGANDPLTNPRRAWR